MHTYSFFSPATCTHAHHVSPHLTQPSSASSFLPAQTHRTSHSRIFLPANLHTRNSPYLSQTHLSLHLTLGRQQLPSPSCSTCSRTQALLPQPKPSPSRSFLPHAQLSSHSPSLPSQTHGSTFPAADSSMIFEWVYPNHTHPCKSPFPAAQSLNTLQPNPTHTLSSPSLTHSHESLPSRSLPHTPVPFSKTSSHPHANSLHAANQYLLPKPPRLFLITSPSLPLSNPNSLNTHSRIFLPASQPNVHPRLAKPPSFRPHQSPAVRVTGWVFG